MAGLFDRARMARIDTVALSPQGDDFNGDLRRFGIDELRAAVRVQLAPEDVARFMSLWGDRRNGKPGLRRTGVFTGPAGSVSFWCRRRLEERGVGKEAVNRGK